jgi:hypothetical protein
MDGQIIFCSGDNNVTLDILDLEPLTPHPLLNCFDRLTYGQNPNRSIHCLALGMVWGRDLVYSLISLNH